MARSASMTRPEAEALLGQRGSLSVNIDNRAIVRKWLVACGVPSSHVGTLTMAKLQEAYNDATETVLAVLEAVGKEKESVPFVGNSGRDESPHTTRHLPAPESEQDVAAALAALRTLFAGSVNEDRVRQIIRDELPDLIPITRLEIKTPTGIKDHGAKARHKQLPKLIRELSNGTPVALVGPAGSGKTTAVEQAAEALGAKFYIQGATAGSHELLGFVDAHGHYQTTPFRQAFEHGGLMCKDEMDADDPAAILVCNSALANCYMAFPDRPEPIARHPDFRFVGCLNTFGQGADRVYVGRNQLDGATLDRFYFISWRYDETLERTLAGNDSWVDRVQALRRGAEHEKARVVISPRASIYGARSLASGASLSEVENALIWKGIDIDLRKRIEQAAKA